MFTYYPATVLDNFNIYFWTQFLLQYLMTLFSISKKKLHYCTESLFWKTRTKKEWNSNIDCSYRLMLQHFMNSDFMIHDSWAEWFMPEHINGFAFGTTKNGWPIVWPTKNENKSVMKICFDWQFEYSILNNFECEVIQSIKFCWV